MAKITCNFCGTEFDEYGYCPCCGSAYGICPLDGICNDRIQGCKDCPCAKADLKKIKERIKDQLEKVDLQTTIRVAKVLKVRLI